MRTTMLGAGAVMLSLQMGAGMAICAENEAGAARAFGGALSPATLDSERGGAVTDAQTQINNTTEIVNTNNVDGRLDRVTVVNSVTGGNSIDGGSFAGAQGFPMVIQNSGNGVLIQNATILNVTIQP